jgi:hypothetical protein
MTNEKGDNTEKSVIEHYYFNIYASQVTLNDFDLEHIARKKLNKRFQFIIILIKNECFYFSEDCQTLEIDFVPYQLYHTQYVLQYF